MKFYAVTAFVCCFLMLGNACKKGKPDKIRIEGYDVFDAAGNEMAHDGPSDDDWTFQNNLNAREMELFNFMPAGVDLANTSETNVLYNMRPYPNPASNSQSFAISVADSVVLKMVVVNDRLSIFYQTAVKIKGPKVIQFDLSDRSTFPNKSSYRVYYSLSATNKPNFKTGYGDVKVCQSLNPWQDCFQ